MNGYEKPMLKKPHGGAREGAGRPAFVPTESERKQVESLSGYGVPIDQICTLVRDGINVDTLRAHFDKELKAGKAKANAQIGQTLFQKAIKGDTTAAIWWSKTQMKWRETTMHEVTGKDGDAMQVDIYHTVFGKLLENIKMQRQQEQEE